MIEIKNEKIIESIISTYGMFKALKDNDYDISNNHYWKTNPYFQSFRELDEYIKNII